jgi:hypothetical protein
MHFDLVVITAANKAQAAGYKAQLESRKGYVVIPDPGDKRAGSLGATVNALKRIKNLDDLPYYREIRKRTDSFARGNADAFDGLFEMNVDIRPDGAWSLEMKPENRAMRRLFTSATLEGNAKLDSAVFKTKDGGISVIRFKELPRVR